MGFRRPVSGAIDFNGESLLGRRPFEVARRGIGFAPEESEVFGELTVEETIAAAIVTRQKKRWRMFSSLHGDASVTKRAREVAEIFGLENRLDTVSQLLSQGEKKLLDVASAFALDPEVILLDEPTSGISTSDKHRVMRTLIAAAERAGVKAMILVEHDMDLVATYSDRIVAIAEGKMLADLPPKQFFSTESVIEIVVGKKRGH
jgi:branched-chain amino acid transport system ATP-binding protein